MKKFILAVLAVPAFLLSAQSFAATCSPTQGMIAEFPKIPFGPVLVSIDGICVKDGVLQTLKPVSVCTEWNGNDDSGCSKSVEKTLYTPQRWTKETVDGEFGFKIIAGTYPLNYQIEVGFEGDGFQKVCEMPYTIPVCLNDAFLTD
jgi:hypothetical protein